MRKNLPRTARKSMEFDRDILALCGDKAIAENSFSTRVNLSMCANASQTRLDGLKNAPGVWYGLNKGEKQNAPEWHRNALKRICYF